jgi:hypothetical protein
MANPSERTPATRTPAVLRMRERGRLMTAPRVRGPTRPTRGPYPSVPRVGAGIRRFPATSSRRARGWTARGCVPEVGPKVRGGRRSVHQRHRSGVTYLHSLMRNPSGGGRAQPGQGGRTTRPQPRSRSGGPASAPDTCSQDGSARTRRPATW